MAAIAITTVTGEGQILGEMVEEVTEMQVGIITIEIRETEGVFRVLAGIVNCMDTNLLNVGTPEAPEAMAR
jgi:F0F1-type ATP synthase epsilon subunit